MSTFFSWREKAYSRADRYFCEVVGAGFDLADINRGSIEPHDHFELMGGDSSTGASSWAVRRRRVISATDYRASWLTRLERARSIVEREYGITCAAGAGVRRALEDLGLRALLESERGYVPISIRRIKEIASFANTAFQGNLGAGDTSGALGFGILSDQRLVFWNIFHGGARTREEQHGEYG
jgi:hypothetical protein